MIAAGWLILMLSAAFCAGFLLCGMIVTGCRRERDGEWWWD